VKSLTSSLFGAIALSLAAIATAHAQAKIDDCEKIQAADAYNQCLAKFGPESKVKSVEPERPGDVKASGSEAAASAGPIKGRGGRHRGRASRGGGRKHISFSVRRRHR
jgi:hypothetical protein